MVVGGTMSTTMMMVMVHMMMSKVLNSSRSMTKVTSGHSSSKTYPATAKTCTATVMTRLDGCSVWYLHLRFILLKKPRYVYGDVPRTRGRSIGGTIDHLSSVRFCGILCHSLLSESFQFVMKGRRLDDIFYVHVIGSSFSIAAVLRDKVQKCLSGLIVINRRSGW